MEETQENMFLLPIFLPRLIEMETSLLLKNSKHSYYLQLILHDVIRDDNGGASLGFNAKFLMSVVLTAVARSLLFLS